MNLSFWPTARTVIAAMGLGFSAVALGVACLDYAGESFGVCGAGTTTGAGAMDAGDPGSGLGSAAPAMAAADCGTTPAKPVDTGNSGTATPPR